jgi:trehalose synthase
MQVEAEGPDGVLSLDLPGLVDVELSPMPLERFAEVLSPEATARLLDDAKEAQEVFAGRTVWNVNSTATGGGVAEMLQSLVPYARSAGVDSRWTVIQGDSEFFRITKRIHNQLHGSPGDGGTLDAAARTHYEAVLAVNGRRLAQRVAARDVVILHDPQTAGLVPLMQAQGAVVVWRCHVGVDEPNDIVRGAWDFLRPYVSQADAYIFSCDGFVWDGLDRERLAIIEPSIDPFAVKNYPLSTADVASILRAGGIEDNDTTGDPRFARQDGRAGVVTHRSNVTESTRITPATPLMVQVSRWDRLKDPIGVLQGFTDDIAGQSAAHLVLAGPDVSRVSDDPEGLQVLEETRAAWRALPSALADRVHLATLQMDDPEENAVMVNALQRRAAVVVQKSLAEGFGLTVAEAMWKARPVVASALGGICDQIEDGVSGILIDPRDLRSFGSAVVRLLNDATAASAMGRAAQERVRNHFLGSRHLRQYLDLLTHLLHE